MISIRNTARILGLGKLALHLYHRPVGLTRDLILDGGPIERRRTRKGLEEMRRAAADLPTLQPSDETYPVTATYLTGENYWYQTVFCFASLQFYATRRINVRIFDDGTLSAAHSDKIRRIVPWVEIVETRDIEVALERHLPRRRYPALRTRRDTYPHLRKLTDLHWGGGTSIVLDSDMLFFRSPDVLLNWMSDPQGVIYLQDVEPSYGYSDELMRRLARGPLPDRMNVGLYGMPARLLDFEYLESCCAEMMAHEGSHYLQEQALTALAISGREGQALPIDDYRVKPNRSEGVAPQAIMHHYVAHSKRSYFQRSWRMILTSLGVG